MLRNHSLLPHEYRFIDLIIPQPSVLSNEKTSFGGAVFETGGGSCIAVIVCNTLFPLDKSCKALNSAI